MEEFGEPKECRTLLSSKTGKTAVFVSDLVFRVRLYCTIYKPKPFPAQIRKGTNFGTESVDLLGNEGY